jgi:uncharacterized RDD family membrane protein YckC
MTNFFYPRLIRRVRAVLIDSVLLPVSIFSTLIVGDALGVTSTFAKAMLFGLPVFVLEPALVAFTGGTVGHHLMKIRITRLDGMGNINILAATVRFVVKLLLGWLSFIFVLTTTKHQAVHDLVARSLVVHKDVRGLPAYDVLPERKSDTENYVYPPAWRRIIVAIAYCVLVYIAVCVVILAVASTECTDGNRCSTVETLFEIALSIMWLVTTGWVAVRGWGGRLYGCRRKPVCS